jgi:hypothetical protein
VGPAAHADAIAAALNFLCFFLCFKTKKEKAGRNKEAKSLNN